MKNFALAVILLALSTLAAGAENKTWANAVFDTPTQAYAFAASVDSPLVVKTNESTPHYVVFIGNPTVSRRAGNDSNVITADYITSDTGAVVVNGGGTSLTVTHGSVQVTAGDYLTATLFRAYGAYEDGEGNRVVGKQQPAIANADGSLADLTAKINQLLAAMRAHGLIAK